MLRMPFWGILWIECYTLDRLHASHCYVDQKVYDRLRIYAE